MTYNPLYKRTLPDLFFGFFSFYNAMLNAGEISLLVEDFNSGKPISKENLGDLLNEQVFSVPNYTGATDLLSLYFKNSLVKGYFTYLDFLGLDATVNEASTTGLHKELSTKFKRNYLKNFNKGIIQKNVGEIAGHIQNGHSGLIDRFSKDTEQQIIATLGYAGLSTGSIFSFRAGMISNGLNYRLPTDFLIHQMAKVDRKKMAKMKKLLNVPEGTEVFDDANFLKSILGRTRKEIAMNFSQFKGENGGCPVLHDPTSKLANQTTDIGNLFTQGITDFLAYRIDRFIATEILPTYLSLELPEQSGFFKQWERLLITREISRFDKEKFYERFDSLEQYYSETSQSFNERQLLVKTFESNIETNRQVHKFR